MPDNIFRIKAGPFNVSLTSKITKVKGHILALYNHYPVPDESEIIDFYISVTEAGGYRRWFRKQSVFSFDGYHPFLPLPLEQAPAFFEWGLNWCIANVAHQYLIIHAAVVEKNGVALIMPGIPGSGKSTLCAALVCNGWRLLSDEMVLLSLTDGLIYPAPRPISLKNESIQIIKSFEPSAVFGDVIANTSKGNVAHMRAPDIAIKMQNIPALPRFLLFPHYCAGTKSLLQDMSKGRAFMELAGNAFNFNILGIAGYEAMVHLMEKVNCYDFVYPDMTCALKGIERLTLQ